jgi:hypothetical protein
VLVVGVPVTAAFAADALVPATAEDAGHHGRSRRRRGRQSTGTPERPWSEGPPPIPPTTARWVPCHSGAFFPILAAVAAESDFLAGYVTLVEINNGERALRQGKSPARPWFVMPLDGSRRPADTTCG